MRSLLPGTLSVLLLLTATGPATSANFRWMNFAPERHFSDEDWEMLTSTADQALNNGQDGAVFTWNNPNTGSSGSMTPNPAAALDGQACRSLSITNEARGLSATGTQRLCRQPDGEWRIVP